MNILKNIKEKFKNTEPSKEDLIKNWNSNFSSSYHINKVLNLEIKNKINIDNHVFNDLEYFDNDSVYKSLSQYTKTKYGKYILNNILKNPLKNYEDIKERQWIINKFMIDNKFYNNIKESLEQINNKDNIFWLWKDNDEQSKTLYDMVYYKIPFIGNFLNKSELLLGTGTFYTMFLSPTFNILIPVLCFLVPYIFLRNCGIQISFMQILHLLRTKIFTVKFISNKTTGMAMLSTIIWFVMYFYNTYTLIKVSLLTNNITNILHNKLQVASKLINISRKIKNKILSFPENIKKILCIPECKSSTEVLLLKDTILNKPSFFNNKGCILSTFHKVNDILDDIGERVKFIGLIDGYYGIVEYLKKLNKLPWTFVKFNKKRNYKKFWHPIILLSGKKPVPNSLKIKNNVNTLLITGPNAAGKSTYVKTIFINSLLAQTLGIALAKKWESPKPYSYIDTYFNVPDIEGKASTFQAEMKRCYKFIKTLDKLKEKDNNMTALIALDEIFTSTNYKEGVAGSYSIIKYISNNYPNVLSLITTHYHCLTELGKNEKIKNYYLDIKRNNEGKIINSYKIKKGISKEHVAIDLLEKEGFHNDIILLARESYNNIKL